MSRRDPRKVPLGWDEAVDLERDPAVVPDPADVDVPPALRTSIDAAMQRYPDSRSATLPALAAAQEVHGWCSPEAIHQVAAVMQVTPAYLSSVATFYDMLRTEPIGDPFGEAAGSAGCARPTYVYVCTSVACHLRAAKDVYDAITEEARDQGLEGVDLREFECLGACDMAPMASVDGRYVGPLTTDDARELVTAIKERREVLPGRGLADPGYRLPWAEERPV
ncbi:MAG TPA: NAD(P)H-dependent oxidoreductase subunit E [Thermoleophilaceae bacterium]|nr:NAD(P)H-dependent oxidoreductase subunit E [Thermoleophilaceae bacterium]